MARLSDEIRLRLKDEVTDIRLETMFEDDQLVDYVFNGLILKGVEQMTDEELVAELEAQNAVVRENIDESIKERLNDLQIKDLQQEWSENSQLLDEAKFQLGLDKALEEN